MSVDLVANLERFLPFEELLGLGLELSDFYGPSVQIPIRRFNVVDEL